MDIEPAGVLYLPARDEILSAERNITPEQLQSQREKELRRTGLLLSRNRRCSRPWSTRLCKVPGFYRCG